MKSVIASLFLPIALFAADERLLDAVRKGNVDAVRQLLRNHAAIDVPQPDGSTPLLLAADHNHATIVDLLIRAGANVNAGNDYGATPLYAACANGNTAIVKMLLDPKADPNAPLQSADTHMLPAETEGHRDPTPLLVH